jgi:hypothetical protein
MYITDLVSSNTLTSGSIVIEDSSNSFSASSSQLNYNYDIFNSSMDYSGFGSFINGTVGNVIIMTNGSNISPPSLSIATQIPTALGLSTLDNRSLVFAVGDENSTFNLNGVSSNGAVTIASGSSNSINLNSDGDITLSPSTSSATNTVIMNNLPTSSAGLTSGSLWRGPGNILNIV